MKRRNLLKVSSFGVAVAATSSTVRAQDKQTFNWKLVMSWPKKFPGLASEMDWFIDEIKKMTGGRLNITVYGAGELVPAFEVFNAVSDGTAEMGHGTPYYWKGKIPEAELFTSVPFGMTADEMNAWYMDGGGRQFLNELYQPFGVRSYLGGNTLAQMGGWFNKEIQSLADIKGLKIRMPGIAGEVYKMAGASPVSLPGTEIFTAMQSGVIDATDWIGPWNDLAFGLHKVGKFYYNGWQEPCGLMEILINEKALKALPEDIQAVLENMTMAFNLRIMNAFAKHNANALDTLVNKHKVQIRDFPADVIADFKAKTNLYLDEYAKKSDISKKIVDSYRTFLNEGLTVSKNTIQIEQYRLNQAN